MTIQLGLQVTETTPGTWLVAGSSDDDTFVGLYRNGFWKCEKHGYRADCEHVDAVLRNEPTRCHACEEVACGQVRTGTGALVAVCPGHYTP